MSEARKYDPATSGTTRYLTDYQNPTGYSQTLQDLDASGMNVQAQYTYDDSGLISQASVSSESSVVSYFHGDHLGSTRLLTDGAGSAIADSTYDYEPYGDPISGSGSLTACRFTGQHRDSALGLQYHRARWLNPSTANWLSADPVFDFPGNFGNPYGYCGGNPTGRSDLSGLFGLAESVAVCSAMGDVIAGLAFKIGNLPFGLQVTRAPLDLTAVNAALTLMLIIGSFVPVLGEIINFIDLFSSLANAIEVIRGNVEGASAWDVAISVISVALVIILILIPGGRFLKSRFCRMRNYLMDAARARKLTKIADIGGDSKKIENYLEGVSGRFHNHPTRKGKIVYDKDVPYYEFGGKRALGYYDQETNTVHLSASADDCTVSHEFRHFEQAEEQGVVGEVLSGERKKRWEGLVQYHEDEVGAFLVGLDYTWDRVLGRVHGTKR